MRQPAYRGDLLRTSVFTAFCLLSGIALAELLGRMIARTPF